MTGTRQELILAGPTASGKSAVALILARELGGEIISADSMQVYRGLDLGTAKPSPAERAAVPHHLVDVVECNESFDAARFLALAREAIEDIHARRRLPIVCGGTGLYIKVLLDGVGSAPPSDPVLRAELEQLPLPILLEELAEKDAATWARIDRNNPRRVVRALEILRLTGRPVSESRTPWTPPVGQSTDRRVFGLCRDPVDLRSRIDARVDQMFRQGLVAETQQLIPRGLAENPVAGQAIGYRQVLEQLRGEHSAAETIALVKVKTRQFAKRQMTWYRHQLPMEWIEVGPNDSPETVAQAIIRQHTRPAAS